MKFYHSLPLQIRFNDIDMAQHVNNAVYMEFFDLGRLGYFRAVMDEPLRFGRTSMVIASIKVDFFQPVFAEDKVYVQTKVVSIGTKSFEMVQQVMKEGETAPKAVSTTTMVCFDYDQQTSVEIPGDWKNKIREFENNEVRVKNQ